MKVRYLGPRRSVPVAGYGEHPAGEIRDYPEAFGRELVAASRRQRFEIIPEPEPDRPRQAEAPPEVKPGRRRVFKPKKKKEPQP